MKFLYLCTTRKKSGDPMTRPNYQEKNIEEVKSPGVFQKIFFWFLIPLMFVIAVLLVIATITNTNIFEKTKELTGNLPFVPSQQETSKPIQEFDEKIVELQAQIEQKEAEIAQLQSQLESEKSKTEEAAILQEELEYEIDRIQREQDTAKKEFTEIVSAFEKMSAKEAAPILVAMSQDEAVRILSSLKSDTLSEVLSKMNPTDAAKFTELLSQ